MEELYRSARRVGNGRTALSILAGVFLAASCVFWGVLHWTVFVTRGAGVPQIAVALVMTVIYTFALPLLLSMLVPTTPAGQMLQKTQWKTVGFPVIIASAGFLAWHARNLMMLWFGAQPAVAEAGQEATYTVAALIGFVVIPALAWVQVTPERWVKEIEQAHLVKKLEVEQRGELAIIKARLLWAEVKAAIGYARLLPAEQKEVRDTLRGLLMGMADTQRGIARTMGIQADVERTILGDKDIADTLDYVEQQLEKPAQLIERNLMYFDGQEQEPQASTVETSQASARSIPSGPDGTRSQEMTQGELTSHYIPPQSDKTRSTEVIPDDPGSSRIARDQGIRKALTAAGAYLGPNPLDDDTRAAIEVLPTAGDALAAMGYTTIPWTMADLAKALHIEEPTARKIAAIWVEQGAAIRGPAKGLAKGRYQFAERGER